MAMEKPVVSTTVGAEGLPVSDGVDILLADDPREFAAAVVKLLRDENLAQAIGAKAAANVRGRFGWDRVAARFSELCERAICPQTTQRDES
jgi:glycosyltransferase involved in cell wall biosynthesis